MGRILATLGFHSPVFHGVQEITLRSLLRVNPVEILDFCFYFSEKTNFGHYEITKKDPTTYNMEEIMLYLNKVSFSCF